MKLAHPFLPLFAALLTGFAYSEKLPGFNVAVTPTGVQYACTVGREFLNEEINRIKISDIKDSYSPAIFGELDYTLSEVKLDPVHIPNITCMPTNKVLTVHSTGISISGKANWYYRKKKWPHISDSGGCTLNISGISVSVDLIVGKNKAGHPTLNTTHCSISVDRLDVAWSGGTSWLYNLFDKSIDASLKRGLNKELCKQLTKLIRSESNKTVETLPVIQPVYKGVELDYSLVEDPTFTKTYAAAFLKGEFLSNASSKETSISPTKLPQISIQDKTRMAFAWLSEYVANTAGIAFQSAGLLTYSVTGDMVPEPVSYYFHTCYPIYKALLPQLCKAFPNVDMKLVLKAIKPPVLRIFSGSVNANITGSVEVLAIQPNKKEMQAFTLIATLYAASDVYTNTSDGNQPTIAGNITSLKVDIKLNSSNIGQFDVAHFQTEMNALISAFGILILNINYINKGFPIPTVEGVSLVNPKLHLFEGYAWLETNISYNTASLFSANVGDHH